VLGSASGVVVLEVLTVVDVVDFAAVLDEVLEVVVVVAAAVELELERLEVEGDNDAVLETFGLGNP
jgi:hypothetical protein